MDLIESSKEGDYDTVKALLDNDADVDINIKDNKALIEASKKGDYNTVKALLKNKDEHIALYEACFNGHENIVRLFIENGYDVNFQCKEGGTTLHFTSYYVRENIVKLLLEHGADVNIQDEWGNTALMSASRNGSTNLVKLLIENDADVSLQNYKGKTALDGASEYGHHYIVKLIKEYIEKIRNNVIHTLDPHIPEIGISEMICDYLWVI